jgi:ADP-heptose:LPS heptosyltransferase
VVRDLLFLSHRIPYPPDKGEHPRRARRRHQSAAAAPRHPVIFATRRRAVANGTANQIYATSYSPEHSGAVSMLPDMISFDCRHYRAAKPCTFNKQNGSECPSCRHFSSYQDRVLFIKLDAIGDVLRSASLLPTVIGQHERPYIAWLTRHESTDLVGMMTLVDEVITLAEDGLARIASGNWTQVYSLSNDITSASLATLAAGRRPAVGFAMEHGVITPSNPAAGLWLRMAAFDRLKRLNTQTYQAHMLAILGGEGPIPPPSLRVGEAVQARAAHRVAALFAGSGRRRVALNIGAGGRWPKKMLEAEPVGRLIHAMLQRADVDIVLVGGAAEQDKTQAVLAACGATARVGAALTTGSIADFVATLMQADALLCGDTLALHVATAIGLPTVAVFGPTSQAEIADFDGLIEKVWAPSLDCLGCYGDCAKPLNCMTALDIDALAARVVARLPLAARG